MKSIKSKFEIIYNKYFKPEIFLIVFGLVFGTIFCLLTPPLYTPDEQAHFWRAYQISEGSFITTEKNNISYGDDLPESIVRLYEHTKLINQQVNSGKDIDFNHLSGYFNENLDESNKSFVGFSSSATYSPVPYLPQAVGIFIGRTLNLSPSGILYIGRFVNLITILVLLFIAIKLTPILKWPFMLFALMPMSISQIASVSGDGIAMALSFLIIALVFKAAFDPEFKLDKKWILSIILVGILLGLCKQSYAALAFLVIIIPIKIFGNWKKYILFASTLIAFSIIPSVIWSGYAERYFSEADSARIESRIEYIKQNPIESAGVIIADTYRQNGNYYFNSTVGNLGWGNISLSFLFQLLPYSLLILLIVLSEKHDFLKITFFQKLKVFLLLAGSVFLISLVLFIVWTRPGFSFVDGVQGRYFIPLLPLLAFLFLNRSFYFKPSFKYPKLYVGLFVCYSCILTIIHLLSYIYF